MQWIIKNVANFGGDPTQITIGGDSAGAGSVRTLLGSPPAKGKFQGAIAQSNLGGDIDLGKAVATPRLIARTLSFQAHTQSQDRTFSKRLVAAKLLEAQIACLKLFPQPR